MKKKILVLLLVLLLSLSLQASLPAKGAFFVKWESVGKDLFSRFKDGKLIVVYAQPFDFTLPLMERERMLFSCPQFRDIAPRFHWVRVWTTFGWGKKTFPVQQPALLVYKDAETRLAQIPMQKDNRSIIEELADLAGVEVKGDIPEEDDLFISSCMQTLAEAHAALRDGNAASIREKLERVKLDQPDSLLAAHLANLLAEAERGPDYRKRAARLRKCAPKVVVAPDLPTFFHYLGRWTADVMFPVLLWDDYLTPAFIARYRPKEVYFPSPVRDKTPLERLFWRALVASLGKGDVASVKQAGPAEYEAARKAVEPLPCGVVFADPSASGLAAAALLASGHFQSVLLDSLAVESPAKVVNEDAFLKLRERIENILSSTGFAWRGHCDDIDYFTLACDLPVGVNLFSRYDKVRSALDDCLFRNDDLTRWGFPGRLLGGEEMKLYQAACSLFLDTDHAFLFDTYPESWSNYRTEPLAEHLDEIGITAENLYKDAVIENWRRHFTKPNTASLVYVNSSGGATKWSIRGKKASWEDVPLSLPTVVNYNHSGSAGNAYSRNTIAGRWLANGAFVYFGSYAEPLLGAFVPPSEFGRRLAEGNTMSWSLRRMMGESFWTPWKLIYFGDPLYVPAARRTKGDCPACEAKYEARTLLKVTARRPAASVARRLARDLKVLRLAAAAGDAAAVDRTVDGMLKRLARARKVPPEAAAAFLEQAAALYALRADDARCLSLFEIGLKVKAPLDGLSFWLYETRKGLITAAEDELLSSKAAPDAVVKKMADLYSPLMKGSFPRAVFNQMVGRLKAFAARAKLDASAKAALKKELLKAAPGGSEAAKALAALK